MPLSLLHFTAQGNRPSWSHFAFFADHGRDTCVPRHLQTISAVPQYNHNRLLATAVVKTTLPFLIVTAGDKALFKKTIKNTATLSDMTIGQPLTTDTMFRTSLNSKLLTFHTVPRDSRIWGRGKNTCLPDYVRHTNPVDSAAQEYCLLCIKIIASAPPYRLDEGPTARVLGPCTPQQALSRNCVGVRTHVCPTHFHKRGFNG
jgi:hypothetical protein